jgi:hypothetical protein
MDSDSESADDGEPTDDGDRGASDTSAPSAADVGAEVSAGETAPVEGMGGVHDHWEDIVADMEATAETYRERGWETLELHPGQVWPQFDDDALDVLVPDSEYEALVEFVDAGDVDDYEVFRAEVATVFFLLVLRDERRERAVFVPGYYDFGHGKKLYYGLDGALALTVHRLRRDGTVAFALDDPEPLFPEEVREAEVEE